MSSKPSNWCRLWKSQNWFQTKIQSDDFEFASNFRVIDVGQRKQTAYGTLTVTFNNTGLHAIANKFIVVCEIQVTNSVSRTNS